jgi:prenyltransferase beta subunit
MLTLQHVADAKNDHCSAGAADANDMYVACSVLALCDPTSGNVDWCSATMECRCYRWELGMGQESQST